MRTPAHAHAADESHGIDLAPMLDFATNLLIFFVITAVFVKQAGVEVSRPSNLDSAPERASKAVVIDERGEISIDAKTIDLRAVRAHIEQFRAAAEGGRVTIAAEERAPTGILVAVIDEIHLGGISDITFAAAPAAD